jgi:hypothetical protein
VDGYLCIHTDLYCVNHFMNKICCALMLCLSGSLHAQVQLITPTHPDAVLEKLGPRIVKPAASHDLIKSVRQAVRLARESGDPRYLGQAQAMMGEHWSNPQASHELLTLQASIEQSRHEYAQASKTLRLALQRPAASKAQAWLTLATIERVQGHYVDALKACSGITEPLAQLYARACMLETISMQGQWVSAREGFAQLLLEQRLPSQQAWLASLQAENELRAGDKATAIKFFALSLTLENDSYTAIAYADTLLDQAQAQAALDVLKTQANTDSVLIRRARAYKMLGNSEAQAIERELTSRFAVLAQRGGMLGHERERALFEWQVRGNVSAAWAAAQENIKLQRESIDWLVALRSAKAAGHETEHQRLLKSLAQSGLKDSRLQ